MCAKFGIPNSSQSPDIEQISDGGISGFSISFQYLTSENCPNSKSKDIDKKLGPVLNLTRERQ